LTLARTPRSDVRSTNLGRGRRCEARMHPRQGAPACAASRPTMISSPIRQWSRSRTHNPPAAGSSSADAASRVGPDLTAGTPQRGCAVGGLRLPYAVRRAWIRNSAVPPSPVPYASHGKICGIHRSAKGDRHEGGAPRGASLYPRRSRDGLEGCRWVRCLTRRRKVKGTRA
jgi:hypothetical protein